MANRAILRNMIFSCAGFCRFVEAAGRRPVRFELAAGATAAATGATTGTAATGTTAAATGATAGATAATGTTAAATGARTAARAGACCAAAATTGAGPATPAAAYGVCRRNSSAEGERYNCQENDFTHCLLL